MQRFIIANNAFLKMLRLSINTDIIGESDIDLFPLKEAKFNTVQDIEVISSGQSVNSNLNKQTNQFLQLLLCKFLDRHFRYARFRVYRKS